jgi:hypothetical protein
LALHFFAENPLVARRRFGIVAVKNARVHCSACTFRGCVHKKAVKKWLIGHRDELTPELTAALDGRRPRSDRAARHHGGIAAEATDSEVAFAKDVLARGWPHALSELALVPARTGLACPNGWYDAALVDVSVLSLNVFLFAVGVCHAVLVLQPSAARTSADRGSWWTAAACSSASVRMTRTFCRRTSDLLCFCVFQCTMPPAQVVASRTSSRTLACL